MIVRTIAGLVIGVIVALLPVMAEARGICSTGAYKTCVACCKTNPAITNRPLCQYQCGDYKFTQPKR